MMSPFILYLLKANVALCVLYLAYCALFQNKTFFVLNRVYLAAALVFAFVVPVLTLPAVPTPLNIATELLNVSAAERTLSIDDTLAGEYLSREEPAFANILHVVYVTGLFFMVLRLMRRIPLRRPNFVQRIYKLGNARVVKTNSEYSYSLFDTVYISAKQDTHSIFQHEKGHVVQKHWVDIVLMEVALLLSWFNPVAWLYRASLRIQLEYLADEYALKRGISLENYLYNLAGTLSLGKPSPLISYFNTNPLKKRILMMTTEKRSHSKLPYLLAAPLAGMLLTAFSLLQTPSPLSPNSITVVIDASHGGGDNGSVRGELLEKDLALDIATKVREACEQKGINAVLTRSKDETLELRQRIDIAQKSGATLFVSIHLNDDAQSPRGADILVSEKNAKYKESLRAASMFSERLGIVSTVHGVRSSGALVLKETTMPAVILEVANLAHEKDREFITMPANQQAVAEGIAEAIEEFVK